MNFQIIHPVARHRGDVVSPRQKALPNHRTARKGESATDVAISCVVFLLGLAVVVTFYCIFQ